MSGTRFWLVYPFLLALAPVLHMAASNGGQFRGQYLADVVLLVTAAVGMVYGIVTLAVRWHRVALAAAITGLLVVAFFYSVPLSDVLKGLSWRLSRPLVLVTIWLLLGAWLLRRLGRQKGSLDVAGRFLAVAGIALVTFNVISLGRHVVETELLTEHSELVRELRKPVSTSALAIGTQTPDIYIVVLDEYANNHVLRERFAYDNREFEDSLRGLGFSIPTSFHSNYTQTRLSLASLLNFAHVTPLEEELGRDATDVSMLTHLIEDNRTVRFLKQRGYRFVYFPSTWFSSTLSSKLADEVYEQPGALTLRRVLTRTELRRVLWGQSLLQSFGNLTEPGDPEHILNTFSGLAEVPADNRPVVAFAHIMAPHEPYVLDAGCKPRAPMYAPDSAPTPETRAGYVAQLRCVNALTLRFVNAVLARSKRTGRRAVIVLQGDHGTSTSDPFASPDSVPDAAALRERFGAFGAYRVLGAEREFSQPMTLANVMRTVLVTQFGAEAPRVPDKLYYSHYDRPFRFTEIPLEMIDPAFQVDSANGDVQQDSASMPVEWDERIPLPAFASAKRRDVRRVVPPVPSVHAEHPLQGEDTMLGVVELPRKISRLERPEEALPPDVQRFEQR